MSGEQTLVADYNANRVICYREKGVAAPVRMNASTPAEITSGQWAA